MGYVKKTPGGTNSINATLSFEGATADNFETEFLFDDPTADRNIEFPNDDGHVVLSKDAARLIGAVPAYGSAVESNVQYDYTQQAIKLYNATDNSIGVAFPAFQVNQIPGQKFKISIAIKGNVASTDGLYIRLQELDSALSGNKTHVCNGAGSSSPFVQEETRQITGWTENAAVPSVWTTYTYTYTPTSTAQWTSVIVLNWTGHGTNSLWMQPPQVTPADGGDPVFSDPEISGLTLSNNTNIVSTNGGDLWFVGLNSISNVNGEANLIIGNNSYDWDNNARSVLELRQWGYSSIVGGASGIAFTDVTQSRIDFTAKQQNTASGADSTAANVTMARIENLIDHTAVDKIQAGRLKLQAYDTTTTNGTVTENSSLTIGNDLVQFDIGSNTITLPNATGTIAVSVSDTTTSTQGDLNLDFTLSAAGNVSATGNAAGLTTSSSPTFAKLDITNDANIDGKLLFSSNDTQLGTSLSSIPSASFSTYKFNFYITGSNEAELNSTNDSKITIIDPSGGSIRLVVNSFTGVETCEIGTSIIELPIDGNPVNFGLLRNLSNNNLVFATSAISVDPSPGSTLTVIETTSNLVMGKSGVNTESILESATQFQIRTQDQATGTASASSLIIKGGYSGNQAGRTGGSVFIRGGAGFANDGIYGEVVAGAARKGTSGGSVFLRAGHSSIFTGETNGMDGGDVEIRAGRGDADGESGIVKITTLDVTGTQYNTIIDAAGNLTVPGSIDNNTVYIYEAGNEPGGTGVDPAGLFNMIMMAEAQTTGNAKRALMVDNGGVMFDPSTNVFRVGGPIVATSVQTGAGGFVSFEGVTDDENETLLAAWDPTQDNVINLPNDSGDVALTSVPTGSTTSSTVLDGEPLVWSQTRPEAYNYLFTGRSLKRGVANVAIGTIRQLRSCYDDTRDLIYLVWVESSGGDTLYINALKPSTSWFPNSSLTWGATPYTQTIGSGFKILGCTYNSDLDLLVVCTLGSSGGNRSLRYYKLKDSNPAGSLGDIVACGQTGGFGIVAANSVGDIVYDKYSKKVYMYAVDNNGAVDTEYWCNARLNFGTDESPTSVSSTTPITNTRNSTVVPVYAKIAINDLHSNGLKTTIAGVYQSDAYCVSGYTNYRVYPTGGSDTQIATGITVFRTGADTRGDQVGITFDPSSNKFVVIYVDENNSATGAIEEVLARPFSYDGGVGATITMGTELELNPGAQFFCDISADRSTGKLLALYRDYDGGSNSAFYHTLVCNDNNTLTSEGFTDLNTTGLIDTVNVIYSPISRSVWGFIVPTDSDIDAYEFQTALTRATDHNNKHLGISKTTDGSRIYKPGEVLTVPADLLPTDLTPGKEVWVNAFGDYICSDTTYKKVGLALSANTVLLY